MAEPENLTEKAEVRSQKLTDAADVVAERLNADVLLYSGDFYAQTGADETVIDTCLGTPRRDNVLLILVTNGGDANIAYRVARCLQRAYDDFYVLVPGWCKSAGTLVAIGADAIVMTDYGQLGPLDVQLGKPDEPFESTSGLDTIQAMNFLKSRALGSFEESYLDLKVSSGHRLSTKTATEIATSLTVGLFQPIYEQIEPNRLGEIARAMSIAEQYGDRLDRISDNLKPGALQKLVHGYPSHRFVIDREEAKDLFRRVREPDEHEQVLLQSLEGLRSGLSRVPNTHVPPGEPDPEPFVGFLSTTLKEDEQHDEGKGEQRDEEQDGGADTEGEREAVESTSRGTGQDLASFATPDGEARQGRTQS